MRDTRGEVGEVVDDEQCRVLFLAVIKRAQDEAEGKYSHWDGEDMEVTKREARAWLTSDSPDFHYICELAGLSSDTTIRLLEEMRGRYGSND